MPDSSVTQCGLSCTMCPAVANASPICSSGSCDFACDTGFHRCNNACVSNTDVDTCGTSCTPCPNGPANSTRTCNGTTCGFQCGGGFNACNGECVPPDFASACGSNCALCPATGTLDRPICSGGTCGTACITSCSAACVDVLRDPMNCGTCGNPCSGAQVCTSGECRTACTTGPAFSGALPYVSIASPATTYRLLAEDLNGDGRVDLVDNGVTTGLNVRYSNADGTFQAPVVINTSSIRPNAFVLADVNADGRKDLIATRGSGTTPNVFVSLNTGTGFGTVTGLSMSTFIPSMVLVADINNDTRPDIIVPASATYFFYFVQTTSGTFPTTYSHWSTNTITNPTSGDVADINKDGRPDLIVANSTSYQVLFNNPSASFTSPITAWSPATAVTMSGIASVKTADLNGDTNPDVIMRVGANAQYALGAGTNTFGSPTALTFPGSTGSPILPVDLNGDSMLDLISGTTSGVYISLATAQATWPAPSNRLVNGPPTVQTVVAAGQLLGTAAPEIFSAPAISTASAISILVNDGTVGTFPGVASSGTSVTSTAGASGDVDGDGDRDLVVTNTIATGGTGTGTVLTGSANATFGIGGTVTLRGDELAIGRLNGDAFADLVATIESTSTPGADVFISAGSGSFAAPTRLATTSLPTKVVIANIDGDSFNDVLVGTSAGVEWFHGNGDGTFGTARIVGAAQGTVQALAVGDLNLDGKADLVINSGTAAVRVYLGYGMGAFQLNPFTSFITSATATDVIVSDLDRDGRPDVAVATSGGVMLFHGDGTGQLQQRTTQSTMLGRLAVADLDSDGFMDLITNNGEVNVARGQTGLTFLARQSFVPGRTLAPSAVIVDRFNNDTFPDVTVFSSLTEVWTYLGTCR